MKMNNAPLRDRDREIGNRLREFRTQIHWSQAAFAREIDLTRDQLANVELGRTPLRYSTAWRIRINFNVNLEWLAGHGGIVNDPADDGFPSPEIVPMSPRCLFDEVANLVAEEKKKAADAFTPISERDIGRREAARLVIEGYMYDWLARVPDDYVMNLANTVCAAGEDLLRKCPPDTPEIVAARTRKLEWERARATAAKRFIMRARKSDIDNPQRMADNPLVRLTWKELKQRLKSVTHERGKKAAAADFAKVDRSNMNRWLDDDQEPGAEAAFRLLEWVTAEEAKQKGDDSVAPVPSPKTQAKGSKSNANVKRPSPRKS